MNTNDHTYLFWIHSLLILSVLIMNEVLYQQQVYAYSRVITDEKLEILTKEEV